MDKISWYLSQKKAINLIDKKEHLSKDYMKEADETLDVALTIKGKWQIISSYYACYNALYFLLMKVGIKSEIHDCTIALMQFFGFVYKDIEFISELKDKQITSQYYLKPVENADMIKVKQFIIKCKLLSKELNENTIKEIRSKIIVE